MITKIDIANFALLRIGQTAITSVDDNHPNALAVRQYWEPSLLAFLGEYNWSFATRVATPGRIVAPEAEIHPHHRAFSLPADFIRLIGLVERCADHRVFPHYERYEIRLVGPPNAVQRVLCCDIEAPTIKYISRDIALEYFTPAALEALGLRLAIQLDMTLNAGANFKGLSDFYNFSRASAIAAEADTSERRRLGPGAYNLARIL